MHYYQMHPNACAACCDVAAVSSEQHQNASASMRCHIKLHWQPVIVIAIDGSDQQGLNVLLLSSY
jgi:hypothetical protein